MAEPDEEIIHTHEAEQAQAWLIENAVILGSYMQALMDQGFQDHEALEIVRDYQHSQLYAEPGEEEGWIEDE